MFVVDLTACFGKRDSSSVLVLGARERYRKLGYRESIERDSDSAVVFTLGVSVPEPQQGEPARKPPVNFCSPHSLELMDSDLCFINLCVCV